MLTSEQQITLGTATFGSLTGFLWSWKESVAGQRNTFNSQVSVNISEISQYLQRLYSADSEIYNIAAAVNQLNAKIMSNNSIDYESMERLEIKLIGLLNILHENLTGSVINAGDVLITTQELIKKTTLQMVEVVRLNASSKWMNLSLQNLGFILAGGVIGYFIAKMGVYLLDRLNERANRDLKSRRIKLEKVIDDLTSVRNYLRSNNFSDIENSEDYQPNADTPDEYICPITQQIIKHPVYLVQDQHAYERKALMVWFIQGNTVTPLTKTTVVEPTLNYTIDTSLNSEIESYLSKKKYKY